MESMKIGELDVKIKAPGNHAAYKVITALQRALGFEAGVDTATSEGDADDLIAVFAASVGLCWGGPPPPVSTFRQEGRNVLDYGVIFWDYLADVHGLSITDIATLGRELQTVLTDRVTQRELDEAINFTPAHPEA